MDRETADGLLEKGHPNAFDVTVDRACQVAHEYHDWDIPSEDEIRKAAMAGH